MRNRSIAFILLTNLAKVKWLGSVKKDLAAPAGESLDSVPDVTDLLNMWSGGGIISDRTQYFLFAIGEDPVRTNDMINTPPMVNEFRTHPELEEAHASLCDIHSEATGHQQVIREDQGLQPRHDDSLHG